MLSSNTLWDTSNCHAAVFLGSLITSMAIAEKELLVFNIVADLGADGMVAIFGPDIPANDLRCFRFSSQGLCATTNPESASASTACTRASRSTLISDCPSASRRPIAAAGTSSSLSSCAVFAMPRASRAARTKVLWGSWALRKIWGKNAAASPSSSSCPSQTSLTGASKKLRSICLNPAFMTPRTFPSPDPTTSDAPCRKASGSAAAATTSAVVFTGLSTTLATLCNPA
mmetsp:Transcript_3343/g.7940  ORF Transcript_3343/g.7940 Transcript_3343/m.7940 type:complete len:229 (+) Transcript_3343:191-877(+)